MLVFVDKLIMLKQYYILSGLWITLNCIRTEQRKCNYLLHKWVMREQTIRYIAEECPLTKFASGIEKIHGCLRMDGNLRLASMT